MAVSKLGGSKSAGTQATPAPRDPGAVMRPMYGIFIRDNLAVFKKDIGATLGTIKLAIQNGELHGDDLKHAKAAVRDLDKAMHDLNIPGGKMPALKKKPKDTADNSGATRPPPGGPHMMYGMFIRNALQIYKGNIQDTLDTVSTAIKSGKLKGTDLVDAKQAQIDLKNAIRDLG